MLDEDNMVVMELVELRMKVWDWGSAGEVGWLDGLRFSSGD